MPGLRVRRGLKPEPGADQDTGAATDETPESDRIQAGRGWSPALIAVVEDCAVGVAAAGEALARTADGEVRGSDVNRVMKRDVWITF